MSNPFKNLFSKYESSDGSDCPQKAKAIRAAASATFSLIKRMNLVGEAVLPDGNLNPGLLQEMSKITRSCVLSFAAKRLSVSKESLALTLTLNSDSMNDFNGLVDEITDPIAEHLKALISGEASPEEKDEEDKEDPTKVKEAKPRNRIFGNN